MDKAGLIRCLVNSRLFIYKSTYGEKGWVVYENLHEEGENVRKQVGRFSTEKKAEAFMALFKTELARYFDEALDITFKEGVTKPIAETVNKLMAPTPADVNHVYNPTGGREAAF